MKPKAFQSRRQIEVLSTLAVGTALSAATATVFGLIFGGHGSRSIELITGVPTLFLGLVWVSLLRWPKTLGQSTFRVGWLLSVPLAMLNAGIAAGLLLSAEQPSWDWQGFVGAMFAGMTIGVIFWGPALAATLLCFGGPIARAQHLAKQGLEGQERGDAFVGAASAMIATLSLFVATAGNVTRTHRGAWFLLATSAAAVLAGFASMVLARRRTQQRRSFVAAVEAGEVPQFRVEAAPEGKVLVRVVSQGEGYRVADFAEAIASIDDDGTVTHISATK
jgi:hypothetical protein